MVQRGDIKDGIEYVEDIRAGWDERTKRINNAAYRTELPDTIIAAKANEYVLIFTTANQKHFNMFQRLNA
ncbi:MAG: hypothetical protein M8353_06125 [ANME-2 cluster archaeon]|nr:hypothetical protein [ANME-2 cluster archaeon]